VSPHNHTLNPGLAWQPAVAQWPGVPFAKYWSKSSVYVGAFPRAGGTQGVGAGPV